MKCDLIGDLQVKIDNDEIIEVKDLQVKYEPGIVDDTSNYAVSINGNDCTISEKDLKTIEVSLENKGSSNE